MLPEHDRVDRSLADEQFTLKVLRLVDEAGLFIALRVYIRMVHVPFAVHDLIPFPVDDRSSCNRHLEHIRVVGYQ